MYQFWQIYLQPREIDISTQQKKIYQLWQIQFEQNSTRAVTDWLTDWQDKAMMGSDKDWYENRISQLKKVSFPLFLKGGQCAEWVQRNRICLRSNRSLSHPWEVYISYEKSNLLLMRNQFSCWWEIHSQCGCCSWQVEGKPIRWSASR